MGLLQSFQGFLKADYAGPWWYLKLPQYNYRLRSFANFSHDYKVSSSAECRRRGFVGSKLSDAVKQLNDPHLELRGPVSALYTWEGEEQLSCRTGSRVR